MDSILFRKEPHIDVIGLHLIDNIYKYLEEEHKEFQVTKSCYDNHSGSIEIKLWGSNQFWYIFRFHSSTDITGEIGEVLISCISNDKLKFVEQQIHKTNYLFGVKVESVINKNSYIQVKFVPFRASSHNMDIYNAKTYCYASIVAIKNNMNIRNWINKTATTVTNSNYENVTNASFSELSELVSIMARDYLRNSNEDENDINGASWAIGIWTDILSKVKSLQHKSDELFCKAFYIYFNVNINL